MERKCSYHSKKLEGLMENHRRSWNKKRSFNHEGKKNRKEKKENTPESIFLDGEGLKDEENFGKILKNPKSPKKNEKKSNHKDGKQKNESNPQQIKIQSKNSDQLFNLKVAPRQEVYFHSEKIKLSEINPERDSFYEEQIAISKIRDEEDTEKDLTMRVYHCANEQLNQTIKACECFKQDVFSLGLVILAMADIDIKKANEDESILKKCISEFQNKNTDPEFSLLNQMIDKMLTWDFKSRYDFVQLLDAVIYKIDVSDGLLISQINLERREGQFTSILALDDKWWLPKEELMKYQSYFASGRWLALTIPIEYIKIMVKPFNQKKDKSKLKKEYEDYFENKIDLENFEFNQKDQYPSNIKNKVKKIFEEKNKKPSFFMKLFQKASSEVKVSYTFQKLAKIYCEESFFIYKLNYLLGTNQPDKCKYFLSFFLTKKPPHYIVGFDKLYRAIIFGAAEENFKIRSQ